MLNLYSTSLFEMIIPFQVFVIAFLIAMILQRQHDDQEIHVDLEVYKFIFLWRKSYSNKATLLLCWSHRYNNYSVDITIWLTVTK
jgi:hypothetical protein